MLGHVIFGVSVRFSRSVSAPIPNSLSRCGGLDVVPQLCGEVKPFCGQTDNN